MKIFLLALFFFPLNQDEIMGQWDLWIPGAVVYLEKDRALYQTYSPGASMNRLTVSRNGSYEWGVAKGKLKKVTPWYAQEGRTYYRLQDSRGNTYDFWYKKETDQLIFLFGEVGGHAATADRWGKKTAFTKDQSAEAQDKTGSKTVASSFSVGDRVRILWSGQWYAGKILEIGKNGTYKVHYDGWGSLYDEWVSSQRIQALK